MCTRHIRKMQNLQIWYVYIEKWWSENFISFLLCAWLAQFCPRRLDLFFNRKVFSFNLPCFFIIYYKLSIIIVTILYYCFCRIILKLWVIEFNCDSNFNLLLSVYVWLGSVNKAIQFNCWCHWHWRSNVEIATFHSRLNALIAHCIILSERERSYSSLWGFVRGHYSATLRMKMHIACVGMRSFPTPANVQNTSLLNQRHNFQ